ncbi:hypothetical protein FDV58_24095 [Bradyrhizobium elkanii]|uniref:Uncharacterized protein n=1 Tax=Bradyrhizobium elkanii TaxID=29448 RepID=A0A4U6RWQ1_BRAEL|nr:MULTISPECIES: hypothetical protein [Bradyrhizobium]MTV13018.1 hypothetical protein [Bradyrhizobium sp. BR2003]TKV78798.1 hypothetical protein FDV58_24095 [Bradyrhizobium elkanii]
MRPTTANVISLNVSDRKEARFNHPREVLADLSLTTEEKRALLASWASDAAAVPCRPGLRAPRDLRSPVRIAAILDALCRLDSDPHHPPGGKPRRLRSTVRPLAA